MATKIKTYKERPECAVPDCTNEAICHLVGQWLCGPCVAKWDTTQREKKRKADEKMFKDIVEATKDEEEN